MAKELIFGAISVINAEDRATKYVTIALELVMMNVFHAEGLDDKYVIDVAAMAIQIVTIVMGMAI